MVAGDEDLMSVGLLGQPRIKLAHLGLATVVAMVSRVNQNIPIRDLHTIVKTVSVACADDAHLAILATN